VGAGEHVLVVVLVEHLPEQVDEEGG
jgi:hypothetical protein